MRGRSRERGPRGFTAKLRSVATAYRVIRVLGEGGVGKVYEAIRESGVGSGRRVAVKVLQGEPDNHTLERFRDEARILSMVRDRAIVWADAPVRLEEGWAVVMDLAPGVDVARLLSVCGPVPVPAAIEIVGEVARALHNLWNLDGPDGPLRVIHRDLKPSNLQISRSGEVRLLDFGNARAEFADREAHTTRHIGGTPGYIAPERLMGVDGPEVDVWSLGVVLQELIVGRRPSGPARITPRTVSAAEIDAIPPAPPVDPTLPAGVARLVQDMTHRAPDGRPTAQQVTRLCRELVRTLPGESLAEWADRAVPSAARALPADARVGALLVVAR